MLTKLSTTVRKQGVVSGSRRRDLRGLKPLHSAFIALVCGAAVLAPAASALADPLATPPSSSESSGLTISPPLVELDVAPGQTVTQKYTITNNSKADRDISPTVQNFTARGETGDPDLVQGDSKYAASTWIKMDPQRQHADANGKVAFDAKITVPANPSPGSHFAAVLFEGATATTPGAVSVRAQVTGLIMLRTPGDVVHKASIVDVKTDKSTYSQGPVKMSVRIKNEGNVHFKPDITFEIRDIWGKKVASMQPIQKGNVLPDQTRKFEAQWDKPNNFNHYQLKAVVKYPEANATYTKSASFWGIPTGMQMIIIGAVVFVLFFIIWLPRKRWKKAFKALASSGD